MQSLSKKNIQPTAEQIPAASGQAKPPDILFTHAFYLARAKHEHKIMKPYVPLGPLAVAAYVQTQGFRVDFFDTTFQAGPQAFARFIRKRNIPLLGIYVLEATRPEALEMLDLCRAAGTTVIAGGPDPSCHPELFIAHGARLVVVGEGEATVLEILQHFADPAKPITDIPGTYSARGFAAPRALRPSLHDLPVPARSLVDFSAYAAVWKKHHGFSSLQLTASRGCPYPCAWCSKAVYGQTFRIRPAQQVAEEMALLKRTYAPDQLWFTDDILGMNPAWVEAFSREVTRLNAQVPFECLSRVDLVSAPLLRHLHDAGCFRIWYGAESGSERILTRMRKNFSSQDIIRSAALTRAAGMETGFFIMLGYLEETLTEIEMTRELLKKAAPDHVGLAVARPIGGTEFFAEVQARQGTGAYRPPFPAWFYWLVKRLLGKEQQLRKIGRPAGVDRLKLALYRFAYQQSRRFL